MNKPLDLSSLFSYWGKTLVDEGGRTHRHPLLHHCLDVGAVAKAWLYAHPSILHQLAHRCQVSENLIASLIVYLATIHDAGKLCLRFQRMAPDAMGPALAVFCNGPNGSYPHHTTLGLTAWYEILNKRPELLPVNGGTARLLTSWYHASFGHHGKPVEPLSPGDWLMENPRNHDFAGAITALHQIAARISEIPSSWELCSIDDLQRPWMQASWTVAGIITLADWVASNTSLFDFADQIIDPSTYFHDHALPQATEALRTCDLLDHDVTPDPRLSALFPAITSLRPLQELAESIPISGRPELYVIEDLTGAGKTEAALTLAARLNANGTARGIYLALPTMATANAMYDRVKACLDQLYPDQSTSIALLHGRAGLALADTTDDDGGAACAAWLTESTKRRMLATVGVGTIDQALLSVLPNKHQSLRLLGLHGKVLIVDEVHACDVYVLGLLERLLNFHAAAGGSVILLSATLPHAQRQKLVQAWYDGRGIDSGYRCTQQAYPLITQCTVDGGREIPVANYAAAPRTIATHLTDRDDFIMAELTALADAGGCACWIRNTVADAQTTWDSLRRASEHPERIHLFHARFALGDRLDHEASVLDHFGPDSDAAKRAGHILIATQVVEQSLDLDFDLVASDIAPIDLLIQRAGRCQRHSRDAIGNRHDESDGRAPLRLVVFAPPPTDDPPNNWLAQPFGGSAAIYPPAQLWRTTMLLQEEGAISVPDRARHLVESVYDDGEDGPARPVPPGLERHEDRSYSDDLAARGLVLNNALRLGGGYGLTGQTWLDDVSAPTRLGEPTITLRLARWDGNTLTPWRNDDRSGWAMSECRIRRFHCPDQESTLSDDACLEAVAQHRSEYRLKKRKDVIILPLVEDHTGHWSGRAANQKGTPIQFTYDATEGLRWEC